jgi:hypothetical protein
MVRPEWQVSEIDAAARRSLASSFGNNAALYIPIAAARFSSFTLGFDHFFTPRQLRDSHSYVSATVPRRLAIERLEATNHLL